MVCFQASSPCSLGSAAGVGLSRLLRRPRPTLLLHRPYLLLQATPRSAFDAADDSAGKRLAAPSVHLYVRRYKPERSCVGVGSAIGGQYANRVLQRNVGCPPTADQMSRRLRPRAPVQRRLEPAWLAAIRIGPRPVPQNLDQPALIGIPQLNTGVAEASRSERVDVRFER